MNKRLPGEAVLRGALASEEASARAINSEPWEPLPGPSLTVKAWSVRCRNHRALI